jgi:type IV secretion system protein VirD4
VSSAIPEHYQIYSTSAGVFAACVPGVLSSAQRHTHFLDSPRMAAVTARSDFAFADLKAQTATVFLVLPPDRLDADSRWLRLLVAQAITDMARSPLQPPSPVLFLLDEFAALGPPPRP